MTNRERVIQAILHKETSIIPYTVDMYAEVREKLKTYYSDPNFYRKLRNHLTFTGTAGFPLEGLLGGDIWRDHFGVRWDKSRDKGVGVVMEPLICEESLESFAFPDPDDPKLYGQVEKVIAEKRDNFIIASVPMGYFERAWSLYGIENLLCDMVGNPGFVERLMERILDYNLKLIGQYITYDVDCVHINDDYGQQAGLIMRPDHWRRFFKPGLRAMTDAIKFGGKYVYFHSCGNIEEIIPDLIEIGVDIINPLQPEVMDVFRLKREYGADITFHGGVSEQHTLNFGTPDDVEREMRDKMARLGKGGGYILAPSQGMTANVPVENAARFIQVATSQ